MYQNNQNIKASKLGNGEHFLFEDEFLGFILVCA